MARAANCPAGPGEAAAEPHTDCGPLGAPAAPELGLNETHPPERGRRTAVLAIVAVSLTACGADQSVVAPAGEAAAPPAFTVTASPASNQGIGELDALVAGTKKPPRPGSDEEKIARVATEFAVSRDAELRCNTLAGLGLVTWLGTFSSDGNEICAQNLREADRFGFGTGLQVRSINIEPSKVQATATVAHVGGPLDGVTGLWQFTKVRGKYQAEKESQSGTWKVTDWKIDYVRAREERLLGAGYVPAGADDALADAGVRDCTNRALQAFNDEDFLSNFYLQFTPSLPDRWTVTLGCLQKQAPGDGERLRNAYRFEVRRSLTHAGYSAAVVECGLQGALAGRSDEEVEQAAVDRGAGGAMLDAIRWKASECEGSEVGHSGDPAVLAPPPAVASLPPAAPR